MDSRRAIRADLTASFDRGNKGDGKLWRNVCAVAGLAIPGAITVLRMALRKAFSCNWYFTRWPVYRA